MYRPSLAKLLSLFKVDRFKGGQVELRRGRKIGTRHGAQTRRIQAMMRASA